MIINFISVKIKSFSSTKEEKQRSVHKIKLRTTDMPVYLNIYIIEYIILLSLRFKDLYNYSYMTCTSDSDIKGQQIHLKREMLHCLNLDKWFSGLLRSAIGQFIFTDSDVDAPQNLSLKQMSCKSRRTPELLTPVENINKKRGQ